MLDDPALPARFRAVPLAPQTEIHVSAVSVWEVAIKRALGKLDVPPDLFAQAHRAGVHPLPITWDHARAVETQLPHSR